MEVLFRSSPWPGIARYPPPSHTHTRLFLPSVCLPVYMNVYHLCVVAHSVLVSAAVGSRRLRSLMRWCVADVLMANGFLHG